MNQTLSGLGASTSDLRRRLVLSVSYADALLFLMCLYLLGSANIANLGAATAGAQRELSDSTGGSLYQIAILGTAVALLFLDRGPQRRIVLREIGWVATILFMWCLLSCAWSAAPLASGRRAIQLILTGVLCAYGFARAGPKRSLDITLLTACLILTLSYLLVALGAGIHSAGDLDGALTGNWRGVHPHKNAAGPFAACVFILAFAQFLRRSHFGLVIVHLASGIFLIQTGSKASAILAAAAAYGAFLGLPLVRIPRPILAATLVASLPMLVWLAYHGLSQINESSFTGRGEIWLDLLPMVGDHFWAGVGYGGVWNIGNASPVFRYTGPFTETLSEGHNGYIDTVLAIGLVGLTLFLIAFYLLPAWQLAFRRSRHGLFVTAILGFTLGHAMFESSFLAADLANWYFVLLCKYLVTDSNRERGSSGASPMQDAASQRQPESHLRPSD